MKRDYVTEVLEEEFDGKIRLLDAFLDSIAIPAYILIVGLMLFVGHNSYGFPICVASVILFVIGFIFSLIAQKLGKPYCDPLEYRHNSDKLIMLMNKKKEEDELLNKA